MNHVILGLSCFFSILARAFWIVSASVKLPSPTEQPWKGEGPFSGAVAKQCRWNARAAWSAAIAAGLQAGLTFFGAAAMIIGLPLGAATAAVSHSFFTGTEIYQNCALPANKAECRSYVRGIADAMGGNTLYGWRACIPLDTTGEVLLAVAMDYLRAHPEDRDGSSASVIAKAMSQAMPCH
jgi:hypothetical protein